MLRKAVKYFLINSVALYLTSLVFSGIFFEEGLKTVVITGIALTLIALVVKPVINVLLLPLNLITFGLFRWVGYTITLYLVTLVVPGFKILNFVFAGFSSQWFSIPGMSFNGVFAIIAYSLVISIISSTFDWLLK